MEAVNGPFIEWGVAGLPIHVHQQSGDRYLVQPVARGVMLAVVDGLGHGVDAAAAAELAVRTLRGHTNGPATSLVQRCHETTRGTRGVVIGLAMIDGVRGALTWLRVGNVAGVVISRGDGHSQQRQTLFLRAGIVGAQLPPVHRSCRSCQVTS